MKILSAEQIRKADQFTISNEPISSLDLMERAAESLMSFLLDFFPNDTGFLIFSGMGNNGGDGLALARLLHESGNKVNLVLVKHSDSYSKDAQANLDRLPDGISVSEIHSKSDFKEWSKHQVWVDALLGSGLTRPLEGFLAELIEFMNDSEAYKVAVDIPTGLFADDNRSNDINLSLKADLTLSFQFPKRSFLIPSSAQRVGDFRILDIGLMQEFYEKLDTDTFLTHSIIKSIERLRNLHSHKGNFGHAFVLAGFPGMVGAGILSAKAALRVGVGKLTLMAKPETLPIFQTAIPEAMVDTHWVKGLTEIQKLADHADAFGAGPGLGTGDDAKLALKNLIQLASVPMVLDADALNLLAENKTWLHYLPADSVLTPHWGEFKRLIGDFDTYEQAYDEMRVFARKYQVNLLVKGPNSCITSVNGKQYFNSSGNPALASPGSGDVLTGMILGFMAQGYSGLDATCLGAYIHGWVADDLVENGQWPASVLAGDLIEALKNWT